ncbi:sigma factor [Paenibacillus sp. NPDC056933]|uniref:sigma factor n=1 Tax=Paenibacillus sp. NPDC056933 TaxID=3345968 RepID=UPI00362868E1
MKEDQIRKAVARRDHEAMEWVMNQYAGLLWKIVYSILHNASSEEIEECVADTFFAFWQNPLSFQPERSSLKNYLATIAKHKAIADIQYFLKYKLVYPGEKARRFSKEPRTSYLDSKYTFSNVRNTSHLIPKIILDKRGR